MPTLIEWLVVKLMDTSALKVFGRQDSKIKISIIISKNNY